jgi:hypothetical protein
VKVMGSVLLQRLHSQNIRSNLNISEDNQITIQFEDERLKDTEFFISSVNSGIYLQWRHKLTGQPVMKALTNLSNKVFDKFIQLIKERTLNHELSY